MDSDFCYYFSPHFPIIFEHRWSYSVEHFQPSSSNTSNTSHFLCSCSFLLLECPSVSKRSNPLHPWWYSSNVTSFTQPSLVPQGENHLFDFFLHYLCAFLMTTSFYFLIKLFGYKLFLPQQNIFDPTLHPHITKHGRIL